MFIQCIFVIATCTQHLLVLGSSTNQAGNTLASNSMGSTQKGKERADATEEKGIFSMHAFVQYAKKIHKEAAKFQKLNGLLDRLLLPKFMSVHSAYELELQELINMKGEFPRFAKADESSSANANQLQSKKLEILEKVKSDLELKSSDDIEFVRSWAMDGLNEARSMVQSKFLNGKPDEATVALFNSVEATNLETAKKLFNKESYYMMGKMCSAISEFYKDKYYFSPSTYKFPFQTKQYKCQIGSEKVAKDVIEVGTCVGRGTLKLSYMKVAIAKVQDIGPDGSFGIQYFIAFDKIKKNPKEPGSWLYETYVAKSFYEKYEKPKSTKSQSLSKKPSSKRGN